MSLISIIIPVLNQAGFLAEAIESYAIQQYPQKEMIIMDGGSTDGTLDVIKRYQHIVTHWESKPDNGQAHAINKGLKLAKGEIVNWLNADDVLLPDALKVVGKVFSEDECLEVLCGKCYRIEGEISLRKQNPLNYSQTLLQSTAEKTMIWPSMGQPAQFYRKTVFDKIGLLNETLHYSFDREFWLRYLLHFGQDNARQTDAFLAVFRLHPDSKTSQSPSLFKEEDEKIIQNIIKQNKRSSPINPRKLKGNYFGKKTCDYYENHNYSKARTFAFKTIKTRTIDGKGFAVCAIKILLLPNFVLEMLRKSSK